MKNIADKQRPEARNFYSVAPFIYEYYLQYWGIQEYDADKCVVFKDIDGEWGIFGNFANTPLTVDGVSFKKSEDLFQMMKFKDPAVLANISAGITMKGKHSGNKKMCAKSYEKDYRREDWGSMIVDAMKFCIVQKYQQSEEFRNKLEQSRGCFIVEAQSKGPDTWGAKLIDGKYRGSNLMGRLLMELRDSNGHLEYTLPDDAFEFIKILKALKK
jgi:ribA/ribD-fused uncharacterized protein